MPEIIIPPLTQKYLDIVGGSREASLELLTLTQNYQRDKDQATTDNINQKAFAADWEKRFGKKPEVDLAGRLQQIEADYKKQVKDTAKKYATPSELDEIEEMEQQEEQLELQPEQPVKNHAQTAELQSSSTPKEEVTREEKKAQIVVEMQSRSSRTIEIKPEQNNPPLVERLEEELSQEEKRKRLIEQMQQSSLDLSQKKELGK